MTNEQWWTKIEKTYKHQNGKWILSDALREVFELCKKNKNDIDVSGFAEEILELIEGQLK